MKLLHLVIYAWVLICIVVDNGVFTQEDDLFDGADIDEAEDKGEEAAAPPIPGQTYQSQAAVKSPQFKEQGQNQIETTTIDIDQLWDEIWASGRSNVSWPKDEYGRCSWS